MVKPWDNGMKRLLAESPQDFLDWLLDGAYFTVNEPESPDLSRRG